MPLYTSFWTESPISLGLLTALAHGASVGKIALVTTWVCWMLDTLYILRYKRFDKVKRRLACWTNQGYEVRLN